MLHTIPPVFDCNSKVLILGTFPSVRSREIHFFYGHPQNRFWKLMAQLLDCKVPDTIDDKRAMLLNNGIALWDVIYSCDIEGSDDATIRNVIPNDLSIITENAQIKGVFTNGKTADKLYRKYCLQNTEIQPICLPSTSPANAQFGIERLVKAWSAIIEI